MTHTTDTEGRYTTDRYFELVKEGVIAEDDHVELLEGVIVAEPPQDPPHATDTTLVAEALRRAVRGRALIRVQMPLVVGQYSVPEPDIAVVPGTVWDYRRAHPTTALLVVEVAASSLPKDRLSKSRIYAAAGIPEYWLINLCDDCVEVFRQPDTSAHHYASRAVAHRGDRLSLVALPDTHVGVGELLLPDTDVSQC
jgi:Uma2 family endonuclease